MNFLSPTCRINSPRHWAPFSGLVLQIQRSQKPKLRALSKTAQASFSAYSCHLAQPPALNDYIYPKKWQNGTAPKPLVHLISGVLGGILNFYWEHPLQMLSHFLSFLMIKTHPTPTGEEKKTGPVYSGAPVVVPTVDGLLPRHLLEGNLSQRWIQSMSFCLATRLLPGGYWLIFLEPSLPKTKIAHSP